MTSAEIIQLHSLDEEDTAYMDFIDSLKNDVVRAVFIMERKDGTIAIGTNSKDRRGIVYDVFRLQQFCTSLANNSNEGNN
jgi:hypothetical protein